jgi:hypothetical protein
MEENKQHRIVDENDKVLVFLPSTSEKFQFNSEMEPNLTGQILHNKLFIEKKQKISDEHKQFTATCSAIEQTIQQLNLKENLLREKLCILQEQAEEEGELSLTYSKFRKTNRKIYEINEKQRGLEKLQSVYFNYTEEWRTDKLVLTAGQLVRIDFFRRQIRYLSPSVHSSSGLFQPLHLSPVVEVKEKTRTKTLEYIYTIGGETQHGKPMNSFERYDPIRNSWKTLPNLPFVRSFMGLCDFDGYIYVIGGRDEPSHQSSAPINQASSPSHPTSSVFRYNRELEKWQEMKSMSISRSSPAVTVLNGYIYVMGGDIGDNTTTQSVERYDPVRNIWKKMSPMLKARRHFGVEVLDGYIHAVGGTPDTYPSIEKYDLVTNEWSMVKIEYWDDKSPLYYSTSTCALNNKLYILNDIGISTYVPSTGLWHRIDKIRWRYQLFGVCVVYGYIYIVSTDDCGNTTLYKYDPQFLRFTSVQQIPNLREYPGIVTSSSLRSVD